MTLPFHSCRDRIFHTAWPRPLGDLVAAHLIILLFPKLNPPSRAGVEIGGSSPERETGSNYQPSVSVCRGVKEEKSFTDDTVTGLTGLCVHSGRGCVLMTSVPSSSGQTPSSLNASLEYSHWTRPSAPLHARAVRVRAPIRSAAFSGHSRVCVCETLQSRRRPL